MILSASGWRKVFTKSGNGSDNSPEIGDTNRYLSALIGETFAQYIIEKTGRKNIEIAVAKDTRPTGDQIAEAVIKALLHSKIKVQYLGNASAPEIMAYSRELDGFLYISASHNPIGHNGIKFGLNDGGVLEGKEARTVIENFKNKCSAINAEDHAKSLLNFSGADKEFEKVLKGQTKFKQKSLNSYSSFIKKVITGTDSEKIQDKIFDTIRMSLSQKKLTLVCDMNGSARSESIDSSFIPLTGIDFQTINNIPGKIVHEIIPEPENLVHAAKFMEQLQSQGNTDAVLGYMPDCDGDRGNVVYWSFKNKKAICIPAQEVFALSVLSECAYSSWLDQWKIANGFAKKAQTVKRAVCVNCPTSMRIHEICKAFNVEVFTAEVGEANVVNCARKCRNMGYEVRILGEGSNGGNITYPSSVRDPLATVYAFIKLLTLGDSLTKDGTIIKGLFHDWCDRAGKKYKANFTLDDIIETLPVYTTTGVSESRAVLQVKTQDKGKMKVRFQKIFENEWKEHKDELLEKYGIASYSASTTNGTEETVNSTDWNNGNGGLKVNFFDAQGEYLAYIWMRPSGTEPVFRVMCDVKGEKPNMEKSLLEWETNLINKADNI